MTPDDMKSSEALLQKAAEATEALFHTLQARGFSLKEIFLAIKISHKVLKASVPQLEEFDVLLDDVCTAMANTMALKRTAGDA